VYHTEVSPLLDEPVAVLEPRDRDPDQFRHMDGVNIRRSNIGSTSKGAGGNAGTNATPTPPFSPAVIGTREGEVAAGELDRELLMNEDDTVPRRSRKLYGSVRFTRCGCPCATRATRLSASAGGAQPPPELEFELLMFTMGRRMGVCDPNDWEDVRWIPLAMTGRLFGTGDGKRGGGKKALVDGQTLDEHTHDHAAVLEGGQGGGANDGSGSANDASSSVSLDAGDPEWEGGRVRDFWTTGFAVVEQPEHRVYVGHISHITQLQTAAGTLYR
jgi:hypothetical protein